MHQNQIDLIKNAKNLERQFIESRDTTHYSIIDDSGNAVSVTYTLGYSFGSGVTIEGTGILGNNQMNNFAHEYGNNSYRRSASPANKLESLKRPMSTMAPIMVFNGDGKLALITGSPGGSQIPNINLQLLVNVLDFNLDIGEATMLPRIHQDSQEPELLVEKTVNFDTRRLLEVLGHNVEISDTIGSTQSIHIVDGVRYGYADLRRPNAKVSIKKIAFIAELSLSITFSFVKRYKVELRGGDFAFPSNATLSGNPIFGIGKSKSFFACSITSSNADSVQLLYSQLIYKNTPKHFCFQGDVF